VFDAADLAVNDTDVEGDPLTVTAVSNAVNGTVSLVGGQITFTPDANFNGAASFDYTVSDGDLTDTVTVNVTVTAVNDAPVLSDPTDISYTDTSATDNFTGVSGSLSAADLDGDSLSYSLTGSVIDNSLAGFGVSVTSTYGKMYLNTSTGAYYFEPNDAAINGLSAGSNPTADFQFTASDGALSSNTQTLTVQLTGANEAATTPTAPPVYTGTGDPNDFDGLGDPDGENLSSTATNGADTLYGGAGNDTINGGGGDDIIYGGSGNDGIDGVGDEDTLYGGSGNDTISGGNFDDTIIGGYGADALNGNNGADTFVYLSTLDTGDTISGFKQGGDADKIDLSGIDANTALANDQAFGSVVNINAVQANSVTWYYDSVSNVTRVWADVNGDTTADLQITLSGNVSLSSGDFIL
jgi:Ca2+-binding RTX toxin-like protein